MFIMDLEASVATADRDRARSNVVDALASLDFGDRPRVVRVNSVESGLAWRDITGIFEAGTPVDLMVLPQVRDIHDVMFADRLLDQIDLTSGRARHTRLEVIIEEATALRDVAAISQVSERIEALVYGPGDLAAALGMPMRSLGVPDADDARYPGHRIHHIQMSLVVAARAAGLRVIDGPFADLHDPDGLRRSCQISRSLGFDGKWCIHPSQIAICNEVFSPAAEDVAWASRVVAALDTGAREGRGAIILDGQMIDAANARMARRILVSAGDGTAAPAERRLD